MGQYKLWMTFQKGIGIFVGVHSDEIEILLPFVQILIGLNKSAKGVYFFGKTS